MRFLIALLALPLLAQDPVATAQQNLTNVQALEAQIQVINGQLKTAQDQLTSANATIASLQVQATFGQGLAIACPTCQAVITSVLQTMTGTLQANWLCCGPTTVPATPPSLPNGYALLVIGPQLPAPPH